MGSISVVADAVMFLRDTFSNASKYVDLCVQRCSSPKYLATVGFTDNDGFTQMSCIKVSVYCVKERLTRTVLRSIITAYFFLLKLLVFVYSVL